MYFIKYDLLIIIIIIIIIIPLLFFSLFFLNYPPILLYPIRVLINRRNRIQRDRLLSLIGIPPKQENLVIGFFHPYCNAGGGGERVLWTAVALHQRTSPHTICAIYTGDIGITKVEMVGKVKLRFGIRLNPDTMLLIHLKFRYLVEASTWPRFTLLGQSIGSIALGYEALRALIPDVYIDTMGYAFTFPLFRSLSLVPIGAYVHYPTISTDMLDRVYQRNSAHNNSSIISNSIILSYAKLIYYKIFAEIYSICLNQADHLMVNSTWTQNHIEGLLKRRFFNNQSDFQSDRELEMESTSSLIDNGDEGCNTASKLNKLIHQTQDGIRSRKQANDPVFRSQLKNEDVQDSKFNANAIDRPRGKNQSRTSVVFPPCDVESFNQFPLKPRSRSILSISQFRPEKDQKTQIESFAKFLSNLNPNDPNLSSIKLILAGSCRDKSDEERVLDLKKLALHLGVANQVEFQVNVSWNDLKQLLSESLVGLSTMIDEHFGISIVEFMASGLIPLAHRSGGPLLDIIVPVPKEPVSDVTEGENEEILVTGFHADGVEDYSRNLTKIFHDLKEDQILKIQSNARKLSCTKFSVHEFEINWLNSFKVLVEKI